MNGDSPLWWLVIPLFASIGLFFVYMFGKVLSMIVNRDPAQKQFVEMVLVIGQPECPDGSFSQVQLVIFSSPTGCLAGIPAAEKCSEGI